MVRAGAGAHKQLARPPHPFPIKMSSPWPPLHPVSQCTRNSLSERQELAGVTGAGAMIRYGANDRIIGQPVSPPLLLAEKTGEVRADRPSLESASKWCGPVEHGDARKANPLVTRLECFIRLKSEETSALDALAQPARPVRAEHVLIHDGEVPNHHFLIVQGVAYRYKLLSDGRRQILGYLLPGDLCELELPEGGRPDHSVAALNNALVAIISTGSLVDLRAQYPNIDRACSLMSLTERSILREWLMNVGQRNAVQRISHFFCEMSWRLQAIGRMNADGSVDLPITQGALADTTGLTTVHVNRSLKRLRKDGLIAFHRQRLMILDHSQLAAVAGFNDDYLRLN